jgi:hypothetical protein
MVASLLKMADLDWTVPEHTTRCRRQKSLAVHIPEGEEIGTVTADGAYDTRRCHTAIIDRHATAIIPIRKNGRPWKEDCPAAIARNETLRYLALRQSARETLDRLQSPKPDRGKDALAGSLEPAALNLLDLKAFQDRIDARHPDRQTAEIQIRVARITRFKALGTAEIIRVA